MNRAVLDSSAVLALLLGEPGAGPVEAALGDAAISTVNFAEAISKLVDHGMPAVEARAAVESIRAQLVSFDADQAAGVGALRSETRALGLSLGDRACLVLARQLGARAVTVDRAWSRVEGIEVELIRSR